MATDKLIITNFTDPVCTWCWGTEPIFRRLETYYNGEIEFRYVMGGLVENINKFTDPRNHIGGSGAESANKEIALHWLEASEQHKMPIAKEGFHLFSAEYPSSYPQNIAYKAAQLVDKVKADNLLRRIREATAVENLLTSHEDVLISLASEVGLDVAKFITHLHDGSAEQAFRGDLALTRSLSVSGFPTFLIKFNTQQVMLRGYNDFNTFASVINAVTHNKMWPKEPTASDEELLNFLELHPRLAAEEIRMAYNLIDLTEVDEWVKRLKMEEKVVIKPAGNSYFVSKVRPAGLSCNLETGIWN